MTTVRVRSMSLSSADAEKLCAEDSADVVNCAVTKLQGPHSGGISDSVKACRSEWGLANPSPTETPTPSPNDKDSKKSNGKAEQKGSFEEI